MTVNMNAYLYRASTKSMCKNPRGASLFSILHYLSENNHIAGQAYDAAK